MGEIEYLEEYNASVEVHTNFLDKFESYDESAEMEESSNELSSYLSDGGTLSDGYVAQSEQPQVQGVLMKSLVPAIVVGTLISTVILVLILIKICRKR